MRNPQPAQLPAIAVAIAEANQLGCQLVERALRLPRNRITVIGCAATSDEALALIAERKPDVTIVSAQLADGPLQGYRVVRELRSMRSRVRAIMLLDVRTRELVTDAFRCGAHGVIFRDEPLGTLTKCIQAVHSGQVWANSEISTT